MVKMDVHGVVKVPKASSVQPRDFAKKLFLSNLSGDLAWYGGSFFDVKVW